MAHPSLSTSSRDAGCVSAAESGRLAWTLRMSPSRLSDTRANMTCGAVGRAGLTKGGYREGKGQSPFSMGTGKEGCPRGRKRNPWKAEPYVPAGTTLCVWPPFSRSAPEPPCHGDSDAGARRVAPTHTSGEKPACPESFHGSLGNVAPPLPLPPCSGRGGKVNQLPSEGEFKAQAKTLLSASPRSPIRAE